MSYIWHMTNWVGVESLLKCPYITCVCVCGLQTSLKRRSAAFDFECKQVSDGQRLCLVTWSAKLMFGATQLL